MNNQAIGVIIVTYNRKKLLLQCLEALKKQTYPFKGIIVVDNASQDGTEKLLYQNNYLDSLPPSSIKSEWEYNNLIDFFNERKVHFTYIKLSQNLGGAGGFHIGLKKAYEKGYKWFWLMDDDGIPSPTCLETLWRYRNVADFINPLVLSKEDENRLCCEILDISTGERIKQKTQIKKDVYFDTANPFNGTFFNRKLVERIGFPKKEFFFWGDEIEYMLRAKKHGFKIATITKAIFYHPKSKLYPIKVDDNIYISWMDEDLRKYLYFRNKIFILKNYFQPEDVKFFVYKYMLAFSKGLLDNKDLPLVIEAMTDGFLEIWGKERRFLKESA